MWHACGRANSNPPERAGRVIMVRDATPADAEDVAVVHVRAWQTGYRGLLPDAYLDTLRPQERSKRYTFGSENPSDPLTILAFEDGALRGFASYLVSHDASTGEVQALYVDPAQWGRGVARLLITEVRTRLAALGCSRVLLWVLAGNARAIRFYTADGWNPDGTARSLDIWGGVPADIVRFERPLP